MSEEPLVAPAPAEAEEPRTGGGGHGGASGRWLVSYADFITLMFVVFMVLYAMARVDSGKFGKLKASLAASDIGGQPLTPLPAGGNPINMAPLMQGPDPDSAPGAPRETIRRILIPFPPVAVPIPPESLPAVETGSAEPEPSEAEPVPQPEPPPPPADAMSTLRSSFLATNAARAGVLKVQLQDRGLVISVLASVLFSQGKSELKPESTGVLDEIITHLKGGVQSILVEGAPDASVQDAPWDLASRRASSVIHYLVTTHGLPAARFAAIGYGKGAGVDGIVNVVVLRRGQ